jgi:anaerobic magnesium-protoporphyrin IX monomethyl ester cyclase
MHITLINPPFTYNNSDDVTISQCLGLTYIAAYLREKCGHTVAIIDAQFEGINQRLQLTDSFFKVGLSNREIVDRIAENTDVIGVSVPFSHLAFMSHELCRDIKRDFPKVPLIMGGVYPSTQPDLAMKSKADYIVLGEGEIALSELTMHISKPDSYPLPSSVVAKSRPASLRTVKASYIEDINILPNPARDLIAFRNYVTKSQRGIGAKRTASIISSRGCPYNCEFCSVHPVCGYKWRQRSPDNVLAEIDSLIETYNIDHFEIEDDNFTLKRDRAMEILKGIIDRNDKRKQKISWAALNGLRIDTLDEEIIKTIARSNCWRINLALEHGDPEMQKIINKNLNLSKPIDVVKMLKRYGISAGVFLIYGYPGETRKRFENGLKYYLKLKTIYPRLYFSYFIAQPYPGTALFQRCVTEGYLNERVFDKMIREHVRFSTSSAYLLETPDFDVKELQYRRSVLEQKLRPKTKRQITLRGMIRSVVPETVLEFAKKYK